MRTAKFTLIDVLKCGGEGTEMWEVCEKARHLAPTAPDTPPTKALPWNVSLCMLSAQRLLTQPFEDSDPFVLESAMSSEHWPKALPVP